MIERDELIRLLGVSALQVWVGALAIAATEPRLYLEIKDPKVGDLVIEITSLGHRRNSNAAASSGFGRLTAVRKQLITEVGDGDDWDVEVDGPIPTDTYWYITTLDGKEERWSNCRFIKVLEK